MNNIFCTLFNYYYLDKALVLIDSLRQVSKAFRLYILCMDDRCYEILSENNYHEVILIKLSDFEDEEMLEAKGNRSPGEYCWTCSSALILYVLETYHEPICTYIDADMCFYQDPEVLIDEMHQAGKSVMIVPHRFSPVLKSNEQYGIYCVEFNTFVNEPNSLKVLRNWKRDCLACCTSVSDGVHYGDQKYLDAWPGTYPDVVHVCQNLGAGMAPWNIAWYKGGGDNKIIYKRDSRVIPVFFFHFAKLSYESRKNVKVSILAGQKGYDYQLIEKIYTDYLEKIETKKQILETKYGIDYTMRAHPTDNTAQKWKLWLKECRLVMWIYNLLFANKAGKEFVVTVKA